jgi:hypothetical protein
MTYVSGDTGDDDLLLAGGLDGGTEVGVVPGVDLALSMNDGVVGVQFSDLREERTVGAWKVLRELSHQRNGRQKTLPWSVLLVMTTGRL